ncbi:MAG: hypothetical protein GY934_00570 [Gammaproteobacteria bacterium]|nr:hypothetical protein [Gammaproteobacteria bacterium]
MERSRLASYASVSRKPAPALAKLLTEASLLSTKQDTSETDPLILSIIALELAGGSEDITLSYAETAVLVSQQSGWTPELLGESNAMDVDRLAQQLVPDEEDGWIRLRFNSSEETDLNLIRDKLANKLLMRLQPSQRQLQPTPAVVKSAKDSLSDTAQSHDPLPAQPTKTVDYRSGLLDEPEVTKTKATGSSGSAFKPAAIRLEEGKVRSSGDGVSKDNPGTVSGSTRELLSAGRSSRPVAPAQTVTSQVVEKGYGISKSYFSQKRQPLAEQNSAIGRGPVGIPASAKTNPPTSIRDFSPDVMTGVGDTERLAAPLPSPSPATSNSLTPGDADDIIAHLNNIKTENTLQPQVPLESSMHKKNVLSDFLDEFAARLHFEADLRGIDR